MSSAESHVTPPQTLIDSIIASVLTPGAGPGLVAAINAALIALILLTLGMLLAGAADIHFAVLCFFAIGLLASLNWYISQVRAMPPPEKKEGEGGSTAPEAKKEL